jgi:hypothetical protein
MQDEATAYKAFVSHIENSFMSFRRPIILCYFMALFQTFQMTVELYAMQALKMHLPTLPEPNP